MNKKDLVAAVVEKTGETQKATMATVDAVFEVIAQSLAQGNEVRMVGFGTFVTRGVKPRVGRNPRTGEQVTIPASKKVAFVAGKPLKDAINA